MPTLTLEIDRPSTFQVTKIEIALGVVRHSWGESMKFRSLLALCLCTAVVPMASAQTATLQCTPDTGQQTFFSGGKAQTIPSETTPADGFQVAVDGGGRPDIVWNKEQWGFKSARAGSLDINFLQQSSITSDFGLIGGGANMSYLLHVNADDAGAKRYVLTVTTFVGTYAVVGEAGVCRDA